MSRANRCQVQRAVLFVGVTVTVIAISTSLLLSHVDQAQACPINYTLHLNFTGQGTVNLNPPNTDCTSATVRSYIAGTQVTLTASSTAYQYCFDHWSGDLTGSTSPGYVTMNAEKTVTAVFIQDTTPPTGTISINGGATYANMTFGTLTLSASDANGVASMRFSNDNSNWSTWEPYATSRYWTFSSGDGTKTVYAQYKDRASNVSTGTISDTIIKDTTPPTGTISINAGAAYTASTSVTLTLSASDTNGVASMQFSNDEGSGWSPFYSYATSKSWTLSSGDGTKTVYARYKDNAGNWVVSGISDSIILDTTPPAVTSMGPTAPNPTSNTPIPVTVNFGESVSGFDAGDITAGNATVSGFSGGGASYSFSLTPSSQGIVTADIAAGRCFDAAGNGNVAAAQFSRTFAYLTLTTAVSPVGAGSVVLTPSGGQYSSGASVQVAAEPDSCWKFDHWGGNLSGSTNPATITMDADKSVTAYFVEGVTIPDANLEAALRSALNKPTGTITCSELAVLESLDLGSLNIANLTGLEHCTGLVTLLMDDNPVTSIAPLSSLEDLEYLNASDCPGVTDWTPLSGLVNLTDLDLTGNEIEEVDFLADLENLEWLYLSYNEIVDLTGFSQCSFEHLKGLYLGHNWVDENNKLSDITGLPAMPNLQVLYLINNAVASVESLPDLPKISWLALWHNQIVDIDRLMALDGLGPGDFVNLYYNPLSEKTLCLDIPKLQARYIEVDHEYMCSLPQDPTTDTTTDSDSDGFTNLDEWTYVGLYAVDPDQRRQMWLEYIFDPDVSPPGTPENFDNLMTCIPQMDVTIEVQGGGAVAVVPDFPGGYTPEPYMITPGTYSQAKYAYDCADPCATAPTCDYNSITLRAIESNDWKLEYWWGEFPYDYDSYSIPGTPGFDPVRVADGTKVRTIDRTMSLQENRRVIAKFVYRPGIDTMDLVNDLGYFLVEIGEITSVDDVWDLTYDKGEFYYDEDGLPVYSGNEIPDGAEFTLLQAALQDRTVNFTSRGGISSWFTWEDYNHNLEQAKTDLGYSTVDDPIVRAVAAYMTLGYYEMTSMMQAELEDHFLVTIDPLSYGRGSQHNLGADEDADQDGATNKEEWEDALAENNGDSLAALATYAANAVLAQQQLPGGGGGGGECGCWNDDGITSAQVTLVSAPEGSFIEVEGQALPVGTCTPTWLTPDQVVPPIMVKLGRSLCVEAEDGWGPPVCLFKTWSAPGTLIHGSKQMDERGFSHVGTVVITPTVKGERIATIPYDTTTFGISWEGIGQYGHLVTCENSPARRTLRGPEGAEILLRCYSKVDYLVPCGWDADGTANGTRLTASDKVRINLFNTETAYDPIVGGGSTVDKWTHSANAETGGFARISSPGPCRALGAITSYPGTDVFLQAIADCDYEFDHWTGLPSSQADDEFTSVCYPGEEVRATAVFRRKPQLTFIVRRIGGGQGAPTVCVGYCSANPAQKYYSADQSNTESNVVTVTAHAQPGYVFVQWRCDGLVAWLPNDNMNAVDGRTLPNTPVDVCAAAETPPRIDRQESIKFRMDTDRTLQAVFTCCQHCGTPQDGSLKGDAQMGELPSGLGRYGVRDTGGDDWGCKHHIHAKLKNVAASWHASHSEENILFNDISKQGGGYWDPHSSHQNGLDVDVAYLSTHEMTEAAIQAFQGTGSVTTVYVSHDYDDIEGTTYSPNHLDHFHVRLSDPDSGN